MVGVERGAVVDIRGMQGHPVNDGAMCALATHFTPVFTAEGRLTQPLITIRATMNLLGQSREIFSDTRSIIQTIRNLHESGNDFVAGLIFLFGIVVPAVKAAMLAVALFSRRSRLRPWIYRFVSSISKWAMADVFVVAVYVAYLSAKATDGLDAQIERGFYYFTAYCLISLLALQVMKIDDPAS